MSLCSNADVPTYSGGVRRIGRVARGDAGTTVTTNLHSSDVLILAPLV